MSFAAGLSGYMRILTIAVLCFASGSMAYSAENLRLNGFLIADPLVPAESIEKGGPPRDGIPALDSPHFVSAEAAEFLDDDDRVLGLSIGGSAKAYPVRILSRHEVVNDWIREPIMPELNDMDCDACQSRTRLREQNRQRRGHEQRLLGSSYFLRANPAPPVTLTSLCGLYSNRSIMGRS